MARFGNILASLAMHSRSQRQQQYQYERDMERQLANDAYRREQDAYARQADEERLNYDRMNNDRQYRFDRDKFDWQKQNADFLNRRLEENDKRAAAKRWADGLTPQDMQEIFRGPRSAPQEILERYDADRPGWLPAGRTMPQLQYRSQADVDRENRMRYSRDPEARARAGEAREYGFERNSPFAETIRHYSRFGVTSPERAEALRLRRAADERAALNYEQTKTQRAAKPAADAVKAENEKRYNQAALELGQYELPKNLKPEAAAKAVADIAKANGVPMKEAARLVAEQYGWNASETAAGQNENISPEEERKFAKEFGGNYQLLTDQQKKSFGKLYQKLLDRNNAGKISPASSTQELRQADKAWEDSFKEAGFDPGKFPSPYKTLLNRNQLARNRERLRIENNRLAVLQNQIDGIRNSPAYRNELNRLNAARSNITLGTQSDSRLGGMAVFGSGARRYGPVKLQAGSMEEKYGIPHYQKQIDQTRKLIEDLQNENQTLETTLR